MMSTVWRRKSAWERFLETVSRQTYLGGYRNVSDSSEVVRENQFDQPGLESRKLKQIQSHQPVMAERLKNRSVLTISGPDSISFLNNMTTSDLSQLGSEVTCLHTFFLNAKGRIIHDALVYRPDEDDNLLFVECDIASLQALQTHLIMFRSRREVEIRDIEQDVSVWSVYDPMDIETAISSGFADSENNAAFLEDLDLGEDVLLSRDPRMWPLGVRVLAPKDVDITMSMKASGLKITDAPNGTYKIVRYKLGIAEGQSEIGYGRSLPVEINGDQTKSISFTKSNYTGWSPSGPLKNVEYRMLPLKFHANTSSISVNTEITDRRGKKRLPIGYLRGIQNEFGLGLMHISSILADRSCLVGKISAECIKPPWWKNDNVADESLKKVRQ